MVHFSSNRAPCEFKGVQARARPITSPVGRMNAISRKNAVGQIDLRNPAAQSGNRLRPKLNRTHESGPYALAIASLMSPRSLELRESVIGRHQLLWSRLICPAAR